MHVSCAVAGKYLLDPFVPPRDLRVSFEGEGYERSRSLGADGDYKVPALRPGTYAVCLKLGDKILHRVEGVKALPGEPTVLAPVDMRGHLRVLRLRVLGSEGMPPPMIQIAAATPRGELLLREALVTGGRIECAVPLGLHRFMVTAADHKAVQIAWRESEQVIRLEAGLRIRIRWSVPGLAKVSDWHGVDDLGFQLQAVAGEQGPAWLALWCRSDLHEIDCKPRGSQEFTLARAGRYEIHWWGSPNRVYTEAPIPQARPQVIEVKAQAGEQVFDISLAASDLERFLLGRRTGR